MFQLYFTNVKNNSHFHVSFCFVLLFFLDDPSENCKQSFVSKYDITESKNEYVSKFVLYLTFLILLLFVLKVSFLRMILFLIVVGDFIFLEENT